MAGLYFAIWFKQGFSSVVPLFPGRVDADVDRVMTMAVVREGAEETMEKRWSERKRLCVGVEVYHHGQLLGNASSRDIGLGGTYLGVESLDSMAMGDDVDLVFLLQNEGESTRHRMSARLARFGEGGAGFKFCNFDTGVFRSLQEILSFQKEKGQSTC